MHRESVSISLFLIFFIAALADALVGLPYADLIAEACFVTFIALEITRVARLNIIAAVALTSIGAGAGLIAGDITGTLIGGAERTVPFLLLFGGVLCLRIPANVSPSLLGFRDTVVTQPAGRRFIMAAVSAHFLTIVFNLAGITLLSSLIRPGTDASLQRRLGRALSQGLASATCWAPFFVAVVVIYSVLPTVRWSVIMPYGLMLSAVLLGWSWAFDRFFVRPGTSPATSMLQHPEYADPLSGRRWLDLSAIMVLLMVAFIAAIAGAGLTIPVAMAIIAPPFAYFWLRIIRRAPRPDTPQIPDIIDILKEVPGLRNEATLFFAANILAVGIGSAVAPESVGSRALDLVGGHPFMLLTALVVLHGLVNALGVHPVVPAILIPTLLPPDVIGVSPEIMALALLAMWGQGAAASPFSATVFVLARLSGCSNWETSWGWNGRYLLSVTPVVIVFLYGLYALDLFA